MARVTVEVNEATNIVEKMYPFAAGVEVSAEPGRYLVVNVSDANVALGWVYNRNVTPVEFAPNPNPVEDGIVSLADLQDKQAQIVALQAEVTAGLASLKG